MRVIIKSVFGYDELRRVEPGDQLKVVCDTFLEVNSVKSTVCQFAKSYPRADIQKYKTNVEKQGDKYIVTIDAVP